jgi:hypothetical protein
MARTLKTTGVAADLAFLIAVDDDDTTIKEWKNNYGITNTGVIVTTAKTWSVGPGTPTTVPMMTIGAGDALTFTSAPSISSPCCYFFVVKDVTTGGDGAQMFRSAATSGGAADSGKAFIAWNATPQPVLRSNGSESSAYANRTFSSGEDFSLFLNDASSGDNLIYWQAEGTAITGIQFTRTGSGFNVTTAFPKDITADFKGDLLMFGILNTTISQANAALIHADPFGTLFEAAVTAGPRSRLTMLGVG